MNNDVLADEHACPAERLSRYISAVTFEQLPKAVVEWAAILVEDNVGCMLGALILPEARALLRVAEVEQGTRSALTLGAGATSVATAVFCNSQLSNLLDFDDSYDYFMPYHPGCGIIPAALAVAESIGASGAELLTAIIVAYEVAMRVGRSVGNVLWGGLPSTAALDELGPAVAAAKLCRLDPEQIRGVFSIIALDESGSQLRPKGELTYHRRIGSLKGNFGSRAQIGVWATMKARAGLTGGSGLLEYGLVDWFRMGLPMAGFRSMTDSLGEEYLCPRISLKPVPSCRMTHHPITAAWNALSDKKLDAAHLSSIRVLGVPRLHRTQWADMVDAQFSVPCSLALAVSGLEPGPRWYLDGAFKSPSILALAGKVVQERGSEAERVEIQEGRFSCRVEIRLKDGVVLEGECQAVKGEPDNPLSERERAAKFAANAAYLPDQGQAVTNAIRGLESAPDVRELRGALEVATTRSLEICN
jgi:2-methylcitrate dehydratase PrpD